MERDLIVLTSLVAAGVVFISILAALMQRVIVIPVTVLAVIFTALVLFQGSERFSELSENLEKAAFFIILAMFIVSFIILYMPL